MRNLSVWHWLGFSFFFVSFKIVCIYVSGSLNLPLQANFCLSVLDNVKRQGKWDHVISNVISRPNSTRRNATSVIPKSKRFIHSSVCFCLASFSLDLCLVSFHCNNFDVCVCVCILFCGSNLIIVKKWRIFLPIFFFFIFNCMNEWIWRLCPVWDWSSSEEDSIQK